MNDIEKDIQRAGLLLCQQLQAKLDEIQLFFDDRIEQIEQSSPKPKRVKTTSKKYLIIDIGT